jgi:hypothetical protein
MLTKKNKGFMNKKTNYKRKTNKQKMRGGAFSNTYMQNQMYNTKNLNHDKVREFNERTRIKRMINNASAASFDVTLREARNKEKERQKKEEERQAIEYDRTRTKRMINNASAASFDVTLREARNKEKERQKESQKKEEERQAIEYNELEENLKRSQNNRKNVSAKLAHAIRTQANTYNKMKLERDRAKSARVNTHKKNKLERAQTKGELANAYTKLAREKRRWMKLAREKRGRNLAQAKTEPQPTIEDMLDNILSTTHNNTIGKKELFLVGNGKWKNIYVNNNFDM